ncbi:MAG: class I SAM-dependent methyltransferase, partial [Delftia sp.]|nr:class I SAM-dependent methyltransferase [Delftia sp.]
SAIPDGLAAMSEMARVLRPGGVLALVDAGYPSDGNQVGSVLARLWELGGDFMRDEADLMQQAGLDVIQRREFGAFDSIRLVVSRKRTAD